MCYVPAQHSETEVPKSWLHPILLLLALSQEAVPVVRSSSQLMMTLAHWYIATVQHAERFQGLNIFHSYIFAKIKSDGMVSQIYSTRVIAQRGPIAHHVGPPSPWSITMIRTKSLLLWGASIKVSSVSSLLVNVSLCQRHRRGLRSLQAFRSSMECHEQRTGTQCHNHFHDMSVRRLRLCSTA